MTTTQKLGVLGATVIAVLAIGALGKMSLAQSQPPLQESSALGIGDERYKLTLKGDSSPSLFVFDGKTGRCWYKASPSDDFKWKEITPPGLPTK